MNAKSAVKNFPVVFVGGSVGGLDAYTRLLQNLPVALITENLDIKPNQVFILPAQRDLHVLNGEFRLKPISKPRGWRLTFSVHRAGLVM